MESNQKFFIGIDLGWKDKKTTGICIVSAGGKIFRKDVFGRNVVTAIEPFLSRAETIAIDAPLTLGRGKGKMRLFEKFLSTRDFRKEKAGPLPPALLRKLCESAEKTVKDLEEKNFSLGINLIETSVYLVKKIVKNSFLPAGEDIITENDESSLICAKIASLHSDFKTGYIGYRDGFLFLPETSFWKEEWQEKFYQAWVKRDRLRYHYLTTNLFK
jgi:predicted nuclease with RNAse H fold